MRIGGEAAVPAAPAIVPPETRRPTGAARLHSRRGGRNQYRRKWGKL